MKDTILVALVVLAFAAFVTAHVTIAVGLLRRHPRWRGVVGFVLAPIAPYWAWHARMRARAVVWLASAIVYAVALTLGLAA